ncbi:putative uncharacterized protein DDB_G0272456 [Macadamia integrifolia]|uniref:putative uncharacterized protein DDB_G0272456 n=1 Tax=Macadamia integrifolia TaxID=60698 RepID=UPI001C52F83D|nr:putative uncharacterized protein DDB_G0272456 [Macadamia integrifolia]
MASSSLRSWRTAFLTLRDETLTSPPRTSLSSLLQHLIFSHSEILISASPDLPTHEVTSDVIFLVELVGNSSESEDAGTTFVHISHLIHEVSRHVCLEMNSSSWATMMAFLGMVVEFYLGKADKRKAFTGNSASLKPIMEILETLRYFSNGYGRHCLPSDTAVLVKLLLHIVTCSHDELVRSFYTSVNKRFSADTGTIISKYSNLWETQTVALAMIGEAFSRVGSFVPVEMWQSTIEVLRKVMDALASKGLPVEDHSMNRFYTSVLHCLHLVLSDPKGSFSEHVASIVAALRVFFLYGLSNRSLPVCSDRKKELSSETLKPKFSGSGKIESGPYRPPHLRKGESIKMLPRRAWDFQSSSDQESSVVDLTSSDSEHSDTDGSLKEVDYFRSSKTRIAAMLCLQDLCQADPKLFTSYWTLLLPTSDVLQPRKYEATLMTCLLFDPVLKARLASASTLAAMLDGSSSNFLQAAEYKESSKRGSFTAFSSSLGQILMQLHTGILYLIQLETHTGLLASGFKILKLLISATPYPRMPSELLPTVISSLRKRILDGFQFKTDQTALLAIALSCLGSALSTLPPSPQVKEMLHAENSTGLVESSGDNGILLALLKFSERIANPTISFEAFQALRAVSHNYPNIMASYWGQVSTIVHGLLRLTTLESPNSEVSIRSLKGDVGNSIGSSGEKFITAAIKVLDECLRAISGFKGTEDLLDDKLLDTPFMSDIMRTKRISSAPSHEVDGPEVSGGYQTVYPSGSRQWSEAIEKHLPLIMFHNSPMVRAASVTCFAGITSSIFFSLTSEKQEYVLSSSISAALNDEVASVRSVACRAIGVMACFPQISYRPEILKKFIHAAEFNTHDPLVSVRITASWALANICDSLRHRANDSNLEGQAADPKTDSHSIALLAECALRLTKDGDKVKSNAVRALGNLSRFVQFTSVSSIHDESVDHVSVSPTMRNGLLLANNNFKSSHGAHTSGSIMETASMRDSFWLERMVQAFLSCVTTGNVKVQWNVCHALSNLFLNETLRLQDMVWAPSVFSILLLLLRDSSNFKIRIHAAAALAVPASRLDYGTSFTDVVQGLVHILEGLGSDLISTPSSFKYKAALEKQLTSSTLHVLGLVSCNCHQPLRDFLVKKASFLEEWLISLCSSLENSNQEVVETSSENKEGSLRKKEMIFAAIRSLLEVYEGNYSRGITQKFENLMNRMHALS